MSTRISPLAAGKPVPTSLLIDVDKLVAPNISGRPDPTSVGDEEPFGL